MIAQTGVDEKTIERFAKSIKKGPFECLSPDSLFHTAEGNDSELVVKRGETLSFPVNKEKNKELDIYDCAVYQAYLDMCRTFHGVKNKAMVERGLIAEHIRTYFTPTSVNCSQRSKETFDSWHKDVIVHACRETSLTIGQIQKLVNMSFKYLFCCRDIRNRHSSCKCFEYCHMALDAYTLEWLKRVDEETYERIPKVKGGRSWSNLDDHDVYFDIVEASRKHCSSEIWPNRENPFYAEFYIWPYEASIESLHTIAKEAKRISVPPELKQKYGESMKTLNELLGKLSELANDMGKLTKEKR